MPSPCRPSGALGGFLSALGTYLLCTSTPGLAFPTAMWELLERRGPSTQPPCFDTFLPHCWNFPLEGCGCGCGCGCCPAGALIPLQTWAEWPLTAIPPSGLYLKIFVLLLHISSLVLRCWSYYIPSCSPGSGGLERPGCHPNSKESKVH